MSFVPYAPGGRARLDGQGGHQSKAARWRRKARNAAIAVSLASVETRVLSSANLGGIFFFPLPGVGETMWAKRHVGGQHLILRAALGARGFARIAVV
jgi:hypothetical protein